MRKSTEQIAKEKMTVTVILGILACLGVIFIFLLIFSTIASAIDVSDGALSVMSGVSLSAGCFAAAYTVAKRRRKNGLLTGFLCGGIVFAAVFLIGSLFVRSFSVGGFVSKLLMILSCSGIGGIIGVNSRRRFR